MMHDEIIFVLETDKLQGYKPPTTAFVAQMVYGLEQGGLLTALWQGQVCQNIAVVCMM